MRRPGSELAVVTPQLPEPLNEPGQVGSAATSPSNTETSSPTWPLQSRPSAALAVMPLPHLRGVFPREPLVVLIRRLMTVEHHGRKINPRMVNIRSSGPISSITQCPPRIGPEPKARTPFLSGPPHPTEPLGKLFSAPQVDLLGKSHRNNLDDAFRNPHRVLLMPPFRLDQPQFGHPGRARAPDDAERTHHHPRTGRAAELLTSCLRDKSTAQPDLAMAHFAQDRLTYVDATLGLAVALSSADVATAASMFARDADSLA